jgi:thioredoxin reductase (NADPH)
LFDVAVIGSGPAGLSAAVYAARANCKVVVIEKEYLGTGQIAESNQVDNYLGLPGINGYDLGERFREHAEGLEIPFEEAEVTELRRVETEGGDAHSHWILQTDEAGEIQAQTIIYAAGAIHRPLALGQETIPEAGISYCAVCDGAFYREKEVAVVGGGDTALDDALYLSEICKKVYLVHRRETFRGSLKTVEKLRQKENVEFVLGRTPSAVHGEEKVSGLELDNGRTLEVSGIFVAIGMIPQTEILKGIVSLDSAGYVPADEMGRTGVPGLYVAGDVRTKELRQVVTAVADGANAAFAAGQYLRQ